MDQRGSAPVEVTAAIVLLMVLVLGVIEVALALYGRNVALASAHEGARAAVEFGGSPTQARARARATAARAAGRLIRDLRVSAYTTEVAGRSLARVHVTGKLRLYGPVPLPVPVSATSSVFRDSAER